MIKRENNPHYHNKFLILVFISILVIFCFSAIDAVNSANIHMNPHNNTIQNAVNNDNIYCQMVSIKDLEIEI
ncbi:hypothetical protein ALNOE001_06050 [Candidatus Methanobinarius endosymbioticus]|uniref:Uncharacterized protein n=1 Tax=Candidatus Methanobinarius endosymbioticus TaxID=2006182 RepID=A0A366MEC5_9EURY|nr:hypothetical protein ALNOE001_06050 [Candidatus Methanobinarius endosymbioticus]